MKTFRLIGMALLAVVMGFNFIACSDDDEPSKNDDGVITNQKQLMQIKMVDDDDESVITEYAYDSNGKLVSATNTEQYDGKKQTTTYTITWGTNKIIENRNGESLTCTLKDGLITRTSDSDGGDLNNAEFTYNSNKQLTQLQDNEDEYTSYTWQGEKLTKISWHEQYYDNANEFSYSGKTCKGYFPIMAWNVDDLHPLLEAHPELVGMRCNQLPDQISNKNDNYEDIVKYTYKFDKDGYIETCTEESTYKRLDINEITTSTTVYTFTWE